VTQQPQTSVAPPLLIRCGQMSYQADPDGGEVTIGRDDQAGVRIDHPMVSRVHAVVAVGADGQWHVTDAGSRNGLYVFGRRLESTVIGDGTTIALGDTAGVEVRFEFTDPDDEITRHVAPLDVEEDDDDDADDADVDPGIKAAGAAVRARRRELDITQRGLAADRIVNAGALIAFEKGRTWPRPATQRKLEEVLQWEPGAITAIRNSYWRNADPDGVTTTMTDTSGEPMLVQAIATGVDTVETAVAALPPPADPRFHERAQAILANLRQLETIAGNAALDARGTPTLAVLLGKIRRLRSQLTTMAAQSPNATLGQRLYAARRRVELTEAETASAAQLPTETVLAIEADEPVPAETASKIEALIAMLARS
jgi:DNA-binding XRE family transcriptional regulator